MEGVTIFVFITVDILPIYTPSENAPGIKGAHLCHCQSTTTYQYSTATATSRPIGLGSDDWHSHYGQKSEATKLAIIAGLYCSTSKTRDYANPITTYLENFQKFWNFFLNDDIETFLETMVYIYTV